MLLRLGFAEELRRPFPEVPVDPGVWHVDQPQEDGRTVPILQPGEPQPAGQAKEVWGLEDWEEEEPSTPSCGWLQWA